MAAALAQRDWGNRFGIPWMRRDREPRSAAVREHPERFALVYERYHQQLYRYCRSIVGSDDDARDALQNAMTRAFAALKREERDFELRPWLFRIVHNEAVSIIRSRRPTTELEAAERDVSIADLEQHVSTRIELDRLERDLAELPQRQRAALVLRELNGLSHDEIAVVLETKTTSVKQAIYDARTALLDCRAGRELACSGVQRKLSDGDGRVLRSRQVGAHLRACPRCQAFADDLKRRPAAMAALFPPLPLATGAAILGHVLGGAHAAGSAGAAGGGLTGSTGAAGAAGSASGVTALATKLAVVALVVAGAGGAYVAQRAVRATGGAHNRAGVHTAAAGGAHGRADSTGLRSSTGHRTGSPAGRGKGGPIALGRSSRGGHAGKAGSASGRSAAKPAVAGGSRAAFSPRSTNGAGGASDAGESPPGQARAHGQGPPPGQGSQGVGQGHGPAPGSGPPPWANAGGGGKPASTPSSQSSHGRGH